MTKFWRPMAVGCAAAFLLLAAFPPFNLWSLAWLALAPLYVVCLAPGLRLAMVLRAAYLFGVVVFLIGAYWMLELGSPPWAMLAFIEALPFAIQAVFCYFVGPRLPRALRPVLFAAVWVAGEWMRGWGRVAFPWFLLAASQVRAPLPLLQLLTLTGQWGLSFAIALTGALLGEAFLISRSEEPNRRRLLWRAVASAAAVPLTVALVGLPIYLVEATRIVQVESEGRTITIAGIQGNITKEAIEKETSESYRTNTMQVYGDLTLQAAHGIERPDLIVWPETVAPGKLLREPDLFEQSVELARAAQTHLLLGTLDVDEKNRMLNTAVYFGPRGNYVDRYDKLQIVPIGEYFPLRDMLGPIYKQYGVPENDMQPGDRPGLLKLPYTRVNDGVRTEETARVGALICYDDVFTTQARSRVRLGAEVLTLMTSDETFGATAGPQQHADLDVLRAVESQRYLIRAAATGPSEVVAPTGEVQSLLPLGRQGILQRRVPLLGRVTLFDRWGDWFAWVCAVVAGAMGVSAACGAYGARRKDKVSGG